MSVFEAVGAHATGSLSDEELSLIEHHACPTAGSCAGMFTANTMASVGEAIGMSLPGSASPSAVDPRRQDFAFESGRAVIELLGRDIRPRDIMTKAAFENAIAVVMALGGSTNAVLHLLAIANEARVELDPRRLQPGGGQGAPHRRHQAPRQVPHGRRRRRGRRPRGDAGTARGRAPPRRLHHGDGQDGGGEPRRARPARSRRQGHPPPVEAHPRRRAASPCCGARWRPNGGVVKVAGIDTARFDGHGPGLRRGAGCPRSHPGREDRARHRRRHPLRRAQGRSRHAGDAGRDRGHEGRGPRRRLRAA